MLAAFNVFTHFCSFGVKANTEEKNILTQIITDTRTFMSHHKVKITYILLAFTHTIQQILASYMIRQGLLVQ